MSGSLYAATTTETSSKVHGRRYERSSTSRFGWDNPFIEPGGITGGINRGIFQLSLMTAGDDLPIHAKI